MSELPNRSGRPRVLSGMRPTGKLHLGNYMGALANWVKLQNDEAANYECYFFIADWHALTTDYADPGRLQSKTIDVALDWLAAGLNPNKSTIFIQSHVPQHAELHLLFSMMTPLGWLERVPTYKEQQENLKGKDLSTYGFLGYPLLQAADILAYQAQYVPVGRDQVAHVELTREVARRFNSMYRTEIFPEPEALLTPSPKLPGTDGRKMSKSYSNTIGLTEDAVTVARKLGAMSTNGQRIRQTDAGDPDQCPVGDLHKIFTPEVELAQILKDCRSAKSSCQGCKLVAAISISDLTQPILERREELDKNRSHLWDMLREQSERAAARAELTMRDVRDILGTSRDLGKLEADISFTGDIGLGYSLAEYSGIFGLSPVVRALKIRAIWIELLSNEGISLSQVGNFANFMPERELEEPFITPRKKRIFVTTQSITGDDDTFSFKVPQKSYEVWALLCWDKKTFFLSDFVIPQKFYSQQFSQARKTLSNDERVVVTIRKEGSRDLMNLGTSEPIDVTSLLGNYDPLN